MSDTNRYIGKAHRYSLHTMLAGIALVAACQRQPVEPRLPPAPAPGDSAAIDEPASPTSALVPLFSPNRGYSGTTTAHAYVSSPDRPAEATDSIETVVWFHIDGQTPAGERDHASRVMLHLDSARTITRGRSRLPRQQIMRDAVSFELTTDGNHTSVHSDEGCTAGSLATNVALQLPLPIFSSTHAWGDSLEFTGCTSMIPTRGQGAVEYLPVDGSPLVVRRRFTLASQGSGMMDSVSVQLSTTSQGDGHIALQLDSIGHVTLLSLADSITTQVEFASEFGAQRFLQTLVRTTEVLAAVKASPR
ncbi:MAG TPA: hypothetical protein VFG84_03325 [Gemmatimonadaceae bacterium]|nr:hypothetical protein [Gemmatimonadaceae bacterium]